MRKIFTTFIFTLFLIPTISLAKPDDRTLSEREKAADGTGDAVNADKEVDGTLEYVACFESGNLSVRNEKLNKVILKLSPNDIVKPFQGWGENKKKKTISGTEYFFIKAQFPDEEEGDPDEGWLPESFVKLKSECEFAIREEEEDKKREEAEDSRDGSISGLKDSNCCEFPLAKYTNSLVEGMAKFNYRRGRGRRLHAACDLYLTKNAPIYAVAGGTVIRDLYKFYQGTWALEVKHQGGFVVRYGEITGKKVKNVAEDKKVTRNQLIGYMGKVNSNCCEPMLHFELYSGKKKGPLKAGGKYKRRSDLLNSTSHLLKWRDQKFPREDAANTESEVNEKN